MMDRKQKYLAYGCGFLMGIFLVVLFFGKKVQTKLQQNRISTVTHPIVLGKDMRAKKPMPAQLAIAYREYPAAKADQCLRVLMLKDQTENRLLRIEETIMRESAASAEKLILRRQMLGDKVLIRLKNPASDIRELTTFFKSLQVSVEGSGRRKGLYYLKLKGDVENPDILSQAMQRLSLNKKIEAVIPVYINDGM